MHIDDINQSGHQHQTIPMFDRKVMRAVKSTIIDTCPIRLRASRALSWASGKADFTDRIIARYRQANSDRTSEQLLLAVPLHTINSDTLKSETMEQGAPLTGTTTGIDTSENSVMAHNTTSDQWQRTPDPTGLRNTAHSSQKNAESNSPLHRRIAAREHSSNLSKKFLVQRSIDRSSKPVAGHTSSTMNRLISRASSDDIKHQQWSDNGSTSSRLRISPVSGNSVQRNFSELTIQSPENTTANVVSRIANSQPLTSLQLKHNSSDPTGVSSVNPSVIRNSVNNNYTGSHESGIPPEHVDTFDQLQSSPDSTPADSKQIRLTDTVGTPPIQRFEKHVSEAISDKDFPAVSHSECIQNPAHQISSNTDPIRVYRSANQPASCKPVFFGENASTTHIVQNQITEKSNTPHVVRSLKHSSSTISDLDSSIASYPAVAVNASGNNETSDNISAQSISPSKNDTAFIFNKKLTLTSNNNAATDNKNPIPISSPVISDTVARSTSIEESTFSNKLNRSVGEASVNHHSDLGENSGQMLFRKTNSNFSGSEKPASKTAYPLSTAMSPQPPSVELIWRKSVSKSHQNNIDKTPSVQSGNIQDNSNTLLARKTNSIDSGNIQSYQGSASSNNVQSTANAAIDIEAIAEQIERLLSRRILVERERRGEYL